MLEPTTSSRPLKVKLIHKLQNYHHEMKKLHNRTSTSENNIENTLCATNKFLSNHNDKHKHPLKKKTKISIIRFNLKATSQRQINLYGMITKTNRNLNKSILIAYKSYRNLPNIPLFKIDGEYLTSNAPWAPIFS